MKLEGIHHITAVTADAPSNADFYVRVLGLRIVKKTINQTDQHDLPHLLRGRAGLVREQHQLLRVPRTSRTDAPGRATCTRSCGVSARTARSTSGSGAWPRRASRPTRSEHALDFCDPEGLAPPTERSGHARPATHRRVARVPGEYALQGFDGVHAYATDAAASSAFLADTLEMAAVGPEPLGGARGAAGRLVPARPGPAGEAALRRRRRPARRLGLPARGHRALERARGPALPGRDRDHRPPLLPLHLLHRARAGCCSRSPSTAGPASPIGEPDMQRMGDELSLPPWLEERRKLYEWSLTPVPTTAELRAGLAVRG